MKKALITGITGQDGSYFVELLLLFYEIVKSDWPRWVWVT
jgi:GDP-D-mannose dehydratase